MKKKTNNFEYTIFGIDLFIKYIIDSIKSSKNKKKKQVNILKSLAIS